jgi:hypothetical protein
MARWYSVRPGLLRTADNERTRIVGSGFAVDPISRSSAGRTKK